MKNLLSGVTIFSVAYLIGGINPAYIISRRKGFDIRKIGTGNLGATNALLAFGQKVGLMVALIDIFKALFIIRLSESVFVQVRLSKEIAGTACILGHVFPVQTRFRGGKGFACLIGVIVGYGTKCFLIFFSAGVILVWLVDYASVVPIITAIAFPFVYLIFGGDLIGFGLYLIVAAVVEVKHIDNIQRIRTGQEMPVSSFLGRNKGVYPNREENNQKRT